MQITNLYKHIYGLFIIIILKGNLLFVQIIIIIKYKTFTYLLLLLFYCSNNINNPPTAHFINIQIFLIIIIYYSLCLTCESHQYNKFDWLHR